MLIEALVRLLMSQDKEWWDGGRGTDWVPRTLARATRVIDDKRGKEAASAYRSALEKAIRHDPSSGVQFALDGSECGALDGHLQGEIVAWAGRKRQSHEPA